MLRGNQAAQRPHGTTSQRRRPRLAVPAAGGRPAQQQQAPHRCVCARASPRPPVPLTTQALLKTQLLQLVTRLNSSGEADDPALQAQMLQVIESLAALTPTPRPAESPLINVA
jgi:hypothetical protein